VLCEQLWDAEGVDNNFNKNVNAKKQTTRDQLQLPCHFYFLSSSSILLFPCGLSVYVVTI